jgi:hypothetical protein
MFGSERSGNLTVIAFADSGFKALSMAEVGPAFFNVSKLPGPNSAGETVCNSFKLNGVLKNGAKQNPVRT